MFFSGRIDDRLVQRMRHRADHAIGRSARQFRVRVQRDHETNLRQDREVADLHREAVVFIAQQLVQVHQLAALALPTHPHSFARVVNPMAMEQKKRSRGLAGVFFVEFAHQLRAVIDQRIILGAGSGESGKSVSNAK